MTKKLTPKERREARERICGFCKRRPGVHKFPKDGSGKSASWTCQSCYEHDWD